VGAGGVHDDVGVDVPTGGDCKGGEDHIELGGLVVVVGGAKGWS